MGRTDSGLKGHFAALISVTAFVVLMSCGSTTGTTTVSSPTPTPDVAAARTAALTIFYAPPGQNVWLPCSSRGGDFAQCPFSAGLKARLTTLGSSGYFSDAPPGVCGEDYITGTQNGLNTAPTVVSAVAGADGSVIVVIRRGPPPPDFTVTMADTSGTWLASDLASGTGQSASIFSAKPNC